MPVTADWQMEFGGLLLGDTTDYSFAKIEGFGMPDVRASDRTRLRRHGMLPGDDFLGGRAVVLELEVFGATDAAFSAAMQTLGAALRPGLAAGVLVLQIPGVAGGGKRRMTVRPRRAPTVVDDSWFYRLPVVACELFATDPRIYDDTQQSLNTGLVASVAGLTWNLTWNLNWGGASTGNSFNVSNAGNFEAPWTARIDGPVTNPIIENVTTGQKLKFTADGGLVLGSGEFLDIDSDARTVLLGGTASRYQKLSSDSAWWDLPPGITQFRFSGTTAGSPLLTVTWRSAWWN